VSRFSDGPSRLAHIPNPAGADSGSSGATRVKTCPGTNLALALVRMKLPACILLVASFASIACGPSDEELCAQQHDPSCPAGKEALVDPEDTCVENLKGPCGDEYEALITCEIDEPSCNTKNPDGSLTLDGKSACGSERDKFLGCARPYVE
jgi:hypothetical protein